MLEVPAKASRAEDRGILTMMAAVNDATDRRVVPTHQCHLAVLEVYSVPSNQPCENPTHQNGFAPVDPPIHARGKRLVIVSAEADIQHWRSVLVRVQQMRGVWAAGKVIAVQVPIPRRNEELGAGAWRKVEGGYCIARRRRELVLCGCHCSLCLAVCRGNQAFISCISHLEPWRKNDTGAKRYMLDRSLVTLKRLAMGLGRVTCSQLLGTLFQATSNRSAA